MPSPSFRVQMSVDPRLRLMHMSFVYAGLFDLAHAGEIALELRWERTEDFVVRVEVERVADGSRRRLCFDIHDRSYVFSDAALRECDAYFKRSFFAPDVERLELRGKVRPFGPIFVTRSGHGRARLAAGLGHALKSRGVDAWQAFRDFTDYLRLPPPSAYERSATEPAPARVLFQTRLWTDAEVTGDPPAAEINGERVRLVRALKSGLGAAFAGGIVPTPLALEKHPDLVCARETHRRAYLATARGCAIGIYSRGLHDSTAWKLGEYLAASHAIVASGLRNALPVPLAPGRDMLAFTTPEECVDLCAGLLAAPERLAALREASHACYRDVARPTRHVLRCFDAAFA